MCGDNDVGIMTEGIVGIIGCPLAGDLLPGEDGGAAAGDCCGQAGGGLRQPQQWGGQSQGEPCILQQTLTCVQVDLEEEITSSLQLTRRHWEERMETERSRHREQVLLTLGI